MSEKQKTKSEPLEATGKVKEILDRAGIRTKQDAREFLVRAGIVTKSGKLTAPYRSSK